jgi:hypothetical protein
MSRHNLLPLPMEMLVYNDERSIQLLNPEDDHVC